jgi:hypothetical protein
METVSVTTDENGRDMVRQRCPVCGDEGVFDMTDSKRWQAMKSGG